MLVSAEGFFLLNFVMDFLVLSLGMRGMCFPRTRRVALAALLGAGYALADGCYGFVWPLHALALIAMFAVALPKGAWRQMSKAVLLSVNSAVILAAAVEALSGIAFLREIAFPAGMLAGVIACEEARRKMRSMPPSIWVRVQLAGRTCSFAALIDTGNILREPLSDLPVMIVSAQTLGKAYQPGLAERRVSYGGVGMGGNLPCIRPKKLELYDNRRWVPAPEMWVGVYSGKINGGIAALAPGAILQALPRR